MSSPTDPRIPEDLRLAFAPLHKRAFGLATGLLAGLGGSALTLAALARPELAEPVGLLSNFFRGYSVSWVGVFVGFAWGAFCGFVFGWFAAFFRNLVFAASVWIVRTRAELEATRDFLDHI